jgi:aminoglycoside 6'-N-acetyltransferase
MHPINFTLLKEKDCSILFEWFMQPHVATWWPEPKEYAAFKKKWLNRIITGYTENNNLFFGYYIMCNNIPIGYIQYYCVTQTERTEYPPLPKHTVGIDLYIGNTEYIGKKLSVPIITQFIEIIIKKQEPLTTVLIIDPAVTNQRAIHVYTKVGFKKIGVFKRTYGITIMLLYKNIS